MPQNRSKVSLYELSVFTNCGLKSGLIFLTSKQELTAFENIFDIINDWNQHLINTLRLIIIDDKERNFLNILKKVYKSIFVF